ncbi:MAG TPA: protein kinase [Opitutaceae bacterium]|nr:protein kinase [Opitutaceae bacterium]
MNESREREEQIFAEALALPPGERPRFLETACRGDAALRRRIEALIVAHESAGGFMEGAAPVARAGAPARAEETAGSRIGRYKLLQRLGVGGCGVVWMAEQEEPVRRRVALKIIKLGMDTDMVIARFEAERQALALMDHPNIARILDAGETDTGRPYFVMELVRGIPITKYCDENNLSTRARLDLFAQVCQAVQHAHQKGIIHRDLKPSNILVTLHDGVPVPKVIDFGIAKATQGRLTDQTLFTAFEQFLGTPAYMSPEQAEMSGIDIDTRSDIYSLGVLLYELLTGRPPFDPKSLLQAGLDEIRRIIREVEPPKPSTNLSTLGDADRLLIAKLRGTDPARLSLLLRGDLDWIVMKAMEKNRARRYETPAALAADVTRHLHDEPVAARPPSPSYRLAKFVRRHRLGCAAAAAVALALVAGTVVSTWQAVRARRAERAARAERARAEDLLGFMLGDLRAQLAKVGRLDVLEAVGDKAMAYFSSRPARDLDDHELARHAQALTQIGEIRMDEARYADATAAFSEAYRRAETLAARHPQDGDMLFERGQAEYWNGFVHWKRGELTAAADWWTRYHDTGLALVTLNPAQLAWRSELAYGQHNLAVLRRERGEFAAARADFLAELATLEKMLGSKPGDPDLCFRMADGHSWLGSLAEQQGEFKEALNQHLAQTAQLEQLATTEPHTALWRFRLADSLLFQSDILLATGQFSTARERLQEALRLVDELTAQDPANRRWQTVALYARLQAAKLARRAGDLTAADRLLEEIRPQLENLVSTEPTDRTFVLRLAIAWRMEAQVRAAAGRPDAAAAAARAVQIGEGLVREGRTTDAEAGACALACVVAGEIAARAGNDDDARNHWQHAADLLAPRLPGSRDWRLLDPAARAAAWLGRSEEARDRIAQLNLLGYVPLDPWPDADRPGAARSSVPPQQSN